MHGLYAEVNIISFFLQSSYLCKENMVEALFYQYTYKPHKSIFVCLIGSSKLCAVVNLYYTLFTVKSKTNVVWYVIFKKKYIR